MVMFYHLISIKYMGILDSNSVRLLPSKIEWFEHTTPSFTNGQTISLTNPGGYKTLLIKNVVLNGGEWDDTYIISINKNIIFKYPNILVNSICENALFQIDTLGDDVTLYATSSDGIEGKTVTINYAWLAEEIDNQVKPIVELANVQVILDSYKTSYAPTLQGKSAHIDVANFRYIFICCETTDSNGELIKKTYDIYLSWVIQHFKNESTTRVFREPYISVVGGNIHIASWAEIHSPRLAVTITMS